MLGFDLSECEKGRTCWTQPKFDLFIFDLSFVKSVIQSATLVKKLKILVS